MRKYIKTFAFAAFATVFLAACGSGGQSNNEASTQDGQTADTLYARKCANCHGGDLQGGFGPALDRIGEQLSKEEILSVIENGQGGMPPKILQGEDADKVAQWLSEMK